MKSDVEDIKIVKITNEEILNSPERYYTLIWFRKDHGKICIDGVLSENDRETMILLSPIHSWRILKEEFPTFKGYVLFLNDSLLNNPRLSSLKINEIRILSAGKIFQTKIPLEIGKRLQAIIEMLEEIEIHNINHREEALLALLNIFFIYCDGPFKFQLASFERNQKTVLVYEFITLLNRNLSGYNRVCQYAEKLNVSPGYLTESTNDVLGVCAKSLIIDQLVRQAEYTLKFTDESVKEIAYKLGFSSPNYFSSFCKKQMGQYPSEFKKVVAKI